LFSVQGGGQEVINEQIHTQQRIKMKFIPDKIILIHEKFARDCLIMQAELALIKAKNDFVLRNLDILKKKIIF